jgi:hypothetical protein
VLLLLKYEFHPVLENKILPSFTLYEKEEIGYSKIDFDL